MNCKPGDLALVIGSNEYAGKLVEVLYAQPAHEFRLPDGYRHKGTIVEGKSGPCWVLKILGAPVRAPLTNMDGEPTGEYRLTQYGCGKDSKLRPLPGLPETEKRDEEVTA